MTRRHTWVGAGRFAAAAAEGVPAPTLTGSPTLLASWDFDKSSTITLSGAEIVSVAGADGTPYTLLTPGNRPTLEARGGRNVARFTSAESEFLQIESACGVDPAVGCTLVTVCEPVNGAVSAIHFDVANGASASTANRYFQASFAGTGIRSRKAGPAANASADQGTGAATAITLAISTFTGGTGTCSQYINGESTPDTSASVVAPSGLSHTTLGAVRASGAQSSFFNGWKRRALIYSGVLDATQAEEVAGWAAINYDLSLNT